MLLLVKNKNYIWSVWKQYRHEIYSYCLQITNYNVHDAEDLLSSVIIKSTFKMPKYANRIYNIKVWLKRITQNEFIDNYRKQSSKVYEKLDTNNLETNEDFYDNDIGVEAHFIMQELSCLIQSTISHMQENMKRVARMYFIEGKSYQEICDEL